MSVLATWLITRIPDSTFPEITLPSSLPPMMLPVAAPPASRRTPSIPLGRASEPVMSRPMKLFCTRLSFVPASTRNTPNRLLPEMTFGAPGSPMTLAVAP